MENEEQRIKEESKFLINKTKKMMKSLSNSNCKKSMNNSYSIPSSREIRNIEARSNLNYPIYDTPKLEISVPSNIVTNRTNLVDIPQVDDKIELKNNVVSMSEKIYELSIENENLRIENKKQKDIIDKLQKKLFESNQKISELNNEITLGLGDSSEVENAKLKRKNYVLEKQIKENKIIYDQIIEEYKNKLKDMNNLNFNKNNELNNIAISHETLIKNSKNLQKQLDEQTNLVNDYSMRYADKENNERINKQKIEKLEAHIRVLVRLIKNMNESEVNNYNHIRNFVGKFNNLTEVGSSYNI